MYKEKCSKCKAKEVIRSTLKSISEEMEDRKQGIYDKLYPFIIE